MAASLAQFGGTDNALTRAEEEHPVIMGVLTVRIHSASRLHSDDPRVFAPHSSTALAVRIETRTWTKRTHLARVDPGAGSSTASCTWDNEALHFPVVIVRRRRHPFNAVRVTLVAKGLGPKQPAAEVGSLGFHLHELAEAARVHGPFTLFSGHHETGTLVMGIELCYGAFGYGRGPRIMGSHGPTGDLRFSLYPRVTPPLHRTEDDGEVLVPRAVRHPTALVGFDEEVAVGPAAPTAGSNLADMLREQLGGDGDAPGFPGGGGGQMADTEARSRQIRQMIARMEDEGPKRYPVVLDRLATQGYGDLLAKLRSLKPAGDGGRRARLDFLHARIESASARSEAARAPEDRIGAAASSEQNSYWQQLQVQKRERSLTAHQLASVHGRAGSHSISQGQGGQNHPLHQQQQQQQVSNSRRLSGIPPLRIKPSQSQETVGGASNTGVSARHRAALDAHSKSESLLSMKVPGVHPEEGPGAVGGGAAAEAQFRDIIPVAGSNTPMTPAQLHAHQRQQASLLASMASPLPPLMARLPASYARFLRPAREVVKEVDLAEAAAGNPDANPNGDHVINIGTGGNGNNGHNSNSYNNNGNSNNGGLGQTDSTHSLRITVEGPGANASGGPRTGRRGSFYASARRRASVSVPAAAAPEADAFVSKNTTAVAPRRDSDAGRTSPARPSKLH